MNKTDKTISKAVFSRRESKYIDFKEKLDLEKNGDWCEIVKDIVAMANSGGGAIIIGVKNDGSLAAEDSSSILSVDPAKFTDKIASYTGEQLDGFRICQAKRNAGKVIIIEVDSVNIPIVFINPGTYDVGEGKQKTAFARGTIYFRHGAKSEPANTKDLKDFVERETERIKKTWLSGIRKVVKAPIDHVVNILPSEIIGSNSASATPIRIVNDPSAPGYRSIDPNATHPHRHKELLRILKPQIEDYDIRTYEIQCVRRIYNIDNNPSYYYKPKFSSSPQFSDSFIEWLVQQFNADHDFFRKAKANG
jgi:hypothetical protein